MINNISYNNYAGIKWYLFNEAYMWPNFLFFISFTFFIVILWLLNAYIIDMKKEDIFAKLNKTKSDSWHFYLNIFSLKILKLIISFSELIFWFWEKQYYLLFSSFFVFSVFSFLSWFKFLLETFLFYILISSFIYFKNYIENKQMNNKMEKIISTLKNYQIKEWQYEIENFIIWYDIKKYHYDEENKMVPVYEIIINDKNFLNLLAENNKEPIKIIIPKAQIKDILYLYKYNNNLLEFFINNFCSYLLNNISEEKGEILKINLNNLFYNIIKIVLNKELENKNSKFYKILNNNEWIKAIYNITEKNVNSKVPQNAKNITKELFENWLKNKMQEIEKIH